MGLDTKGRAVPDPMGQLPSLQSCSVHADPHLCFKHTDAEAGGCYKANSSLSDFARPCCLRVDVGHVRPLVPRLATSPPGETMCDADRLQYRQPSTWHLHKTQANSYNARRRLSIRSHSSGHTDTAQTQRYG